MKARREYIAVDLGASNGRVIVGAWSGETIQLREVHRFANGGVRADDSIFWDAQGIWSGILDGLKLYSSENSTTPVGIGVDAWGVDYGLLDDQGKLLGNPHHYRDPRTHGVMERVDASYNARSFYQLLGVQPMGINTIYQLIAMREKLDQEYDKASRLLMIPDLFQYFLSGEICSEFSEATTTQLFDTLSGSWSYELLEMFNLRADIMVPVCKPGTRLGMLRDEVWMPSGYSASFPAIAVASHDTASAVAAIPAMDSESAFLSCGTWSLLGICTEKPIINQMAFDIGLTNEGAANGGYLAIRNLTGLWILQECVREWKESGKGYTWEKLAEGASRERPLVSLIDTEDPIFQSPGSMIEAISGWCRDTGQEVSLSEAALVRCILESLALKYSRSLDELQFAVQRPLSILRMVGGGVQNKLLCQMTADACQRMVVAGPVEAAALGNVLVQMVACGDLDNLAQGDEVIQKSEVFQRFAPQGGVKQQWWDAAERLDKIIRSRSAHATEQQ